MSPRDAVHDLARMVEESSGNVIPPGHFPFLAEVAARRAAARAIGDVESYVRALERGALEGEWRHLLPLVTIKESYLFRTPQHFLAVAAVVLPSLIRARAQRRTLSLWSAGCALACAILTNSDDGGIITAGVFSKVMELYFDAKAGLPKPIETPSKDLKEFIGRYQTGTECFDLKVKDGYLVYHHIPLGGFPNPDSPPGPAMPPMRFAFYEKNKVIGLDEPYQNAMGDSSAIIKGSCSSSASVDGRIKS